MLLVAAQCSLQAGLVVSSSSRLNAVMDRGIAELCTNISTPRPLYQSVTHAHSPATMFFYIYSSKVLRLKGHPDQGFLTTSTFPLSDVLLRPSTKNTEINEGTLPT